MGVQQKIIPEQHLEHSPNYLRDTARLFTWSTLAMLDLDLNRALQGRTQVTFNIQPRLLEQFQR